MSLLFRISLILAGLLTVGNFSAAQEKPNIIILIADDISVSDFGCYGNTFVRTPNIDQLANNGVKFTNAFLTTSSCSPSRVSIITGRYPHNTGAAELHTDMAENQVLFPKMIKDAGYYTAQAGKWHFGAPGDTPNGKALEAFERTGGSVEDGGGPSGSKKWVTYLKERPEDKPFFMWFAAHDAHREWDDQIFLKPYEPEEVIVPVYMVDNESTRKDLIAYYDEVTRFDFFVGEVVKELKEQDILENTLLIVMADNGRPFPRDKTTLYDDGIKTPFIIHWPEKISNGGAVSKSLLSVIDIAPTITEVAGIEASPTFQGRSFLKLLSDPQQKFRDYVFAEHNWHDFRAYERMVRTTDFLYIENGLPQKDNRGAIDVICSDAGEELKKRFKAGNLSDPQKKIFLTPQPEIEFYNCAEDSLQINNLYGRDQFTQEQNKLAMVLNQWKKETKDSQPEILTPDWYSRQNCQKLPEHGIRGIMPGSDMDATAVNKPGPF